MLKKPGSATITSALRQIGEHLVGRSGTEKARLIVEPAVYQELANQGLRLYTWRTDGVPAPPKQDCLEMDDLIETVDLIVCIGGDGTLLWASGIFKAAMPPVISFSMGSVRGPSTTRRPSTRAAHPPHAAHPRAPPVRARTRAAAATARPLRPRVREVRPRTTLLYVRAGSSASSRHSRWRSTRSASISSSIAAVT